VEEGWVDLAAAVENWIEMRVCTQVPLLLQNGYITVDMSARDPGSATALPLLSETTVPEQLLPTDLRLYEKPIKMQRVGFVVRVH